MLITILLPQDLLDLRQANWVSRREESGPKLISEVHKDAAMDAIKKTLGVDVRIVPWVLHSYNSAVQSGPPPSRRSEDRSDRRKSQVTGLDTWTPVVMTPGHLDIASTGWFF